MNDNKEIIQLLEFCMEHAGDIEDIDPHDIDEIVARLNQNLELAKQGKLTEGNYNFPNGSIDLELPSGNDELMALRQMLEKIDGLLADQTDKALA